MYWVYIIECSDGSLYTGITTDLERRLEEHRKGKGGNYTRAKEAVKIVYTQEHPNRSSASKREAEIKKLKREQKLRLLKKAR
jgi:putative endonuclease